MGKKKRPVDTNVTAKLIADIATGEITDPIKPQDEIKAAAAALGSMGGLKGGKARAASLSPKKRSEIARKAAEARWSAK